MDFWSVLCLLLVSVVVSNQKSLFPSYLDRQIPLIHREAHSKGARITGGEDATEGQFPYQVALKIKLVGLTTFCGGTLISKQDVLTAAHCCEGAQKIEVILGAVEIHNETDTSRVSMLVLRKNMKLHEKWDTLTLANDICMLRLPKEVQLSENIKIADLPEDDSEDYADELAVASGWGRVSDQAQTISSVLQFIKSKIIKNSLCNIFYFGLIKDTHLCTNGAGGVSTCNGDSGGPLVLETGERNSTTMVGVTSFGVSFGCEVGWPPVFTRVSKYLEWIRKNMN